MTNTYFIQADHQVFEDSFEDGVGTLTNTHTETTHIVAPSPEKAIETFIEKHLYWDIPSADIVMDDEGRVDISTHVDAMGLLPNSKQFVAWKKGKLLLYSDQVSLTIHLLTPVKTLKND